LSRKFAWNAKEGGCPGAGGHEHGVISHAAGQLRNGKGFANDFVDLETHAAVTQALHLTLDDVARQAERRNAVTQHTTDHVQGFKDRYFGTELDQIGSSGQTTGAGADDRNATERLLELHRFDFDAVCVVADKALQPANRHRLHLGLDQHTLGLALTLLRADPAADRREDARLMNRGDCSIQVAHQQVPDETRNVDADRVPSNAGRNNAHDAALGFAQGGRIVVAQVDFGEGVRSLLRVALGHLDLMALQRRIFFVGALALHKQFFFQVADVGGVLIGLGLLLLEAFLARVQFLEVHLVAVKIRAIDAGKLDFAANRDAAGAAHAGAIDHDGVERDHGLDAVRARGLNAGMHHGHRSDGHHQIGLLRIEQVFQCGRYKAGPPKAAIVGANDQFVSEFGQLIGPEHQLVAAKTDDAGGAVTDLLESAQLREDRLHAEAAADQHDMTDLSDVLWQTQGADKVVKAVALLVLVAHRACGLAQRLHAHGDGAAGAVKVGHGQGNAFAVFMQTQHHKMPRLCGSGDIRRQNFPQKGVLGEDFATNYGVHRGFTQEGIGGVTVSQS